MGIIIYGPEESRKDTGSCKLNKKVRVIEIRPGRSGAFNVSDKDFYYEVDLDRCKNASELLDWIFHLMQKSWFTSQVLFDFITCIRKNCYLENKDERFLFCQNFGRDINWEKIIEKQDV